MPRAGDVYSLPSNYEAVAGETATATQHNSPLEDIETDLNTARPVAVGGTGGTTAAAARSNLGIDTAFDYQAKSSTYTLVAGDKNGVTRFTATATANLTAAATLGSGWFAWIIADGGTVTVDPNASETINGDATLTIGDGNSALVVCNGTAFFAISVPGVLLDEDDMASDSATAVATQQSIKAWTTGKQSIWIPAAAMTAAQTSGAQSGQTEETTNKHNYSTLAFDASSDEYACFEILMPESWDEGTLTFKAVWTTTATDADGVAWGMQAVAVADGDDSDVAYGTAVVVTDDAQSNAGDVLISAESGAVTVAGSPAAGELTQFRVFRDVSDANDDMTEDALLRGIRIFYTIDTPKDG